MTLAELQALLHGRITGMVPGREDELREQVVPRPPLDSLERVEIYARMYLHRLVDAIAEDSPQRLHAARLTSGDRRFRRGGAPHLRNVASHLAGSEVVEQRVHHLGRGEP